MTIATEILKLSNYYGAKLNDDQIDLYLDALSDIREDDLHAAIVEIIKTSKWMPKISEIRTEANSQMEKRITAGVDDWTAEHRGRWARVGLGGYRSSERLFAPVELKWKVCPNCGVDYANWDDCPDCSSKAEVELWQIAIPVGG